ncbi:MAG: cytochrome b/b6 domain-containing protein [Sphingomonadales bacterium]|jgi:cytochrome b561
MQAPAKQDQFSRLFTLLHWLIAALVIFQLFMNAPGVHGIENLQEKSNQIVPHATIGIFILALMILRFVLRRREERPEYGEAVKSWQVKLGTASHHSFYALLILQPILGLLLANAVDYDVRFLNTINVGAMLDFSNMQEVLHLVHGIIPLLLTLLVLIHISAAVFHAIRRDGVFRRMSPFS